MNFKLLDIYSYRLYRLFKKLNWAITIILIITFIVPTLGNLTEAASYPKSYITIDANKHTMDGVRAEATGVLKGQIDGYYVNNRFFISGMSNKEVTKNGQQFRVTNVRGTSADDLYSDLTVYIIKPTTIYKAKIISSSVTVKHDGSIYGQKIGTLKKNDTVEVTQTIGTWTRIKFGNVDGWVESKSVQRIYPRLYKGHVTADELTVRNSNNTNGKKLGTIKKNTAVYVVEDKNGWYKIEYKDGYGWVSNKYIKKVKYAATVTSSTLNVYSTNSKKGKKLGTLKKNNNIDVISTKGSWSQIKYKTGYAWVESKSIKKK